MEEPSFIRWVDCEGIHEDQLVRIIGYFYSLDYNCGEEMYAEATDYLKEVFLDQYKIISKENIHTTSKQLRFAPIGSEYICQIIPN